jgi:predicted kinase
MVCEAIVGMDAWRALPVGERSTLFTAALLHDVAKPRYTERDAEGRISSRGHSLGGSYAVRAMIYRGGPRALAAPFKVREQIVGLVRHHGLPLSFLQSTTPERAVIRASATVRCDLLAVLAEADARGRVSDNRAELIDRVGLFREFCAEQRCLDSPRAFATDHARFVYFSDGRAGPDYVPHERPGGEVVVMAGLPGAGKDSYVRRELADWPVVSSDDLRREMGIAPTEGHGAVFAEARERARAYLRRGERFVWNATNVILYMRRVLIGFLTQYGGRVRVAYVESDYPTLRARNAGGRVPSKVVERLIDRLSVPDPTEAPRVDYVVQ